MGKTWRKPRIFSNKKVFALLGGFLGNSLPSQLKDTGLEKGTKKGKKYGLLSYPGRGVVAEGDEKNILLFGKVFFQ